MIIYSTQLMYTQNKTKRRITCKFIHNKYNYTSKYYGTTTGYDE